jgi:ubiquinone/menaquinone biosynthesis C-methylase UbiE
LAGTGATIVGCDISKKLIAQAIAHARRNGTRARTTFLVADADTLPFRDETFDIVLTYGALHHLPDPARTCRDIQRIVRPGGVHLGSENNKTALRPLFDLLMKVKQLWVEEAGEQPLISESMIRQWTAGSQPIVHCRTSVFVPPHLVNLLGERIGGALLGATDAMGGVLPFVRRNGGLLVFEIERRC